MERVEIKDVKLPVQLQRAMAAEAEAAREARAKVMISSYSIFICNFFGDSSEDKDLHKEHRGKWDKIFGRIQFGSLPSSVSLSKSILKPNPSVPRQLLKILTGCSLGTVLAGWNARHGSGFLPLPLTC